MEPSAESKRGIRWAGVVLVGLAGAFIASTVIFGWMSGWFDFRWRTHIVEHAFSVEHPPSWGTYVDAGGRQILGEDLDGDDRVDVSVFWAALGDVSPSGDEFDGIVQETREMNVSDPKMATVGEVVPFNSPEEAVESVCIECLARDGRRSLTVMYVDDHGHVMLVGYMQDADVPEDAWATGRKVLQSLVTLEHAHD